MGWGVSSYAAGAAAAAGALSVGMASVASGARVRIVAFTAVGMGIAAFVGSATASLEWLHLPIAAAWAAAAGMLVVVDGRLMPVGVNSLVAMIVFGRFANTPGQALLLGAVVGAGGLLQVMQVLVTRRRRRPQPQLAALAAAYRELAGFAAAVGSGVHSGEAAAAIDAAAAAVARVHDPGPAGDAWDSLIDEADRIRLELVALAGARELMLRRLPMDDPLVDRVDRALAEAARLVEEIAATLAAGRPTTGAVAAASATSHFAPLLGPATASPAPGEDTALDAARAATEGLAGQLRAVAGVLPVAVGEPGGRSRRNPLTGAAVSGAYEGVRATLGTLLRRLRANATWDGSAARHALRLAAAVVLAALVGRLTGLARPYWIALTAVTVLRPDFATTFSRGASRAMGTLLGVGIASAVAIALPPRHWGGVVLFGLFTWVAAALFRASFLLFSAGLTGAVVFLLAGLDASPVADAVDRLIATVLGSALALLIYAVWPSWAQSEAHAALAAFVDAHRAYMDEVLEEIGGDRPRRREVLDSLDRQRRLARGNAEAAVARSLADPPQQRIDGRMARGVLAAVRRQVIAAHTLRTRLLDGGAEVTAPEVVPLATALDGALRTTAAALRGDAGDTPASLRPVHGALVDRLEARPLDPQVRALLELETDEIVDAANTLTYRLRRPAAAAVQP